MTFVPDWTLPGAPPGYCTCCEGLVAPKGDDSVVSARGLGSDEPERLAPLAPSGE